MSFVSNVLHLTSNSKTINMKKIIFYFLTVLLLSCATTEKEFEKVKIVKTQKQIFQTGIATWYGKNFVGKKTSSGMIYDMYNFTAAHRDLPLRTIIRVTNVNNNRSVLILVNDRGPVNETLILDLSKIAANNIDITRKGSGKVEVEILASGDNPMKKIFDVYKNVGNGI